MKRNRVNLSIPILAIITVALIFSTISSILISEAKAMPKEEGKKPKLVQPPPDEKRCQVYAGTCDPPKDPPKQDPGDAGSPSGGTK
jgi:hypothetical protein